MPPKKKEGKHIKWRSRRKVGDNWRHVTLTNCCVVCPRRTVKRSKDTRVYSLVKHYGRPSSDGDKSDRPHTNQAEHSLHSKCTRIANRLRNINLRNSQKLLLIYTLWRLPNCCQSARSKYFITLHSGAKIQNSHFVLTRNSFHAPARGLWLPLGSVVYSFCKVTRCKLVVVRSTYVSVLRWPPRVDFVLCAALCCSLLQFRARALALQL